jgi:hypothetical protein
MKATVDRIEGTFAVLVVDENGKREYLNYPIRLLKDVAEGDILDITITRDESATVAARKRVASLIEKLKSR